jgi:Icc-related predicted phosphoesterase
VANKPTSPQDTTGRAVEDAQKRAAAEKAKTDAAAEAARQAEVLSLENDVFDPKHPDAPILIDEIEELGVSVNNDYVIIRTVSDIEDMTFGVVNGTPQNYTFKAGVQSRVPRAVADHLRLLGYTYTA